MIKVSLFSVREKEREREREREREGEVEREGKVAGCVQAEKR